MLFGKLGVLSFSNADFVHTFFFLTTNLDWLINYECYSQFFILFLYVNKFSFSGNSILLLIASDASDNCTAFWFITEKLVSTLSCFWFFVVCLKNLRWWLFGWLYSQPLDWWQLFLSILKGKGKGSSENDKQAACIDLSLPIGLRFAFFWGYIVQQGTTATFHHFSILFFFSSSFPFRCNLYVNLHSAFRLLSFGFFG